MSSHIPDFQLRAFTLGDVLEDDAVNIALHLDECARCAARTVEIEPLALAFAAMDEPILPDDLVEQVVMAVAADHRRRVPFAEMAVGAGLLVAACTMVLLGSDPVGLLVQAAATLPQLGQLVSQASLSIGALVLAIALFVVGSSVALRFSARRST